MPKNPSRLPRTGIGAFVVVARFSKHGAQREKPEGLVEPSRFVVEGVDVDLDPRRAALHGPGFDGAGESFPDAPAAPRLVDDETLEDAPPRMHECGKIRSLAQPSDRSERRPKVPKAETSERLRRLGDLSRRPPDGR